MARLWGSHCCWTQQWSLRQGTYRSCMGGASEANYEVQEVIKVGGGVCPDVARAGCRSPRQFEIITNPAEHRELQRAALTLTACRHQP